MGLRGAKPCDFDGGAGTTGATVGLRKREDGRFTEEGGDTPEARRRGYFFFAPSLPCGHTVAITIESATTEMPAMSAPPCT